MLTDYVKLDYLREENRVLRDQLSGKRLRLNDEQRRRLAVKAKKLGRRVPRGLTTIVKPETLLTWHYQGFNCKPRVECLNGEIFYSLKEAQVVIEQWRVE